MSYFEELHPEMDRYLEDTASAEPEILKRLRKETFQKTTQPHMISGYLQGRFLSLISKMISPKIFWKLVLLPVMQRFVWLKACRETGN